MSSDKVLTPYLMPRKVDGIGTFILGNSSSGCGIGLPTSPAFFPLSGVVGRFAPLVITSGKSVLICSQIIAP